MKVMIVATAKAPVVADTDRFSGKKKKRIPQSVVDKHNNEGRFAGKKRKKGPSSPEPGTAVRRFQKKGKRRAFDS